MNGYPYVSCLNPQQIVNPYTLERMVVPCGHCVACALSKSSNRTLKCKLESMSHRYTYFVTLTFNNTWIPLADIAEDEFGSQVLYDIDSGEIVAKNLSMSEVDILALKRKCNCGGFIPYLSKRIVQLFLKRLRKLIKNEKIRYYIVGEYGPIHFRPHYHLLLWFDEPCTAANLGMLVRQAWKFGYIDCEKSKGDCSKYVAGYLNSSCNLPRIYKESSVKPFCLHSFFLGEKILQGKREEVYEMSVSDFVKRSFFIDGTYTEFTLWRSLKAVFYPKCPSFTLLSPDVRFLAYRLYYYAKKAYGTSSIKVIADNILDSLKFDLFPMGCYHSDSLKSDLIELLVKICRLSSAVLSDPDCSSSDLESAWRTIYMALRTSRHFLNFVCNGDFSEETSRFYLSKIESFYKEYDYFLLKEQYKELEEFDYFDDEDMMLMYGNVDFKKYCLKQSRFYYKFCADTAERYRKSIKHKELNDLNQIFNNM